MSPRLGLIMCLAALALPGCGHRQHQTLGTGRIVVAGSADLGAAPGVVAPGAVGAAATSAPPTIALPAASPGGRYRVRYQLWLPRAMEVSWTLRCGSYEERGVAGETFAQYRARRLGELQAAREQERQRRAQLGAVVGDVLLGQVQTAAAARTPTAGAEATVTVDGAAAGAALGAATVEDATLTLAPDDLGQGYRQGEVRFVLGDSAADAGGACALEVAPLEPTADAGALAGTFEVERWFDARRAERVRVAGGAVQVRAELHAQLVAGGADVTLQARRRAEAQAALELRAQAAARARVAFDGHVRAEVWQTREALYTYLGTCGGNRHYREELRAAEERRQLELTAAVELRARVALDVRAQLRGGLIAHGADPDLAARLRAQWADEVRRRTAVAEAHAAAELAAYQAAQDEAARRAAMAVGVRVAVLDTLVALGARARPPMPPPIDEYTGTAPSSDATWRAGYWSWTGAEWAWSTGRWIGGPAILTVDVGASGSAGGSWSDDDRRAPARDHRAPASDTRTAPPPAPDERPQSRDHRAEPAPPPTPTPPTPTPAPPKARPRVRDHR